MPDPAEAEPEPDIDDDAAVLAHIVAALSARASQGDQRAVECAATFTSAKAAASPLAHEAARAVRAVRTTTTTMTAAVAQYVEHVLGEAPPIVAFVLN